MNAAQLVEKHFQTLKVDHQAWLSLYAPDAVVEMPNSPHPHPTKVEGLEAIGASVVGFVGSMGDDFNVQIRRIYPIDDEDAAFVEFTMTGTVTLTGKKYEQNYVSYFRAENGKIVLYREYFDSSRIAAAFVPDE
ncbi:snoaL-like domain-containing protein [Trichoderma breve]|uniref:SnoaL-like domain-containing protein n=1 Tax=Trichoderma breve TaxID=2034170 RepID=A0A9W9BCJ8_9HYPO|nr:snoaL-like domain-containing protein [Trichoderma breve]KAJ4857835.1 snoaL-like domain-containing protein [Trichoderma breve]